MSTYARILVTTDLSEQALPAVQEAAALARSLGSRIELLFVVEDHLPPILMFTSEKERKEILARQASRAERQLREFAEEHLEGCSVKCTTLVGTAAQEIVRRAEAQGIELIVMASRGYGPMRQLLLGSTAERVLHHAPCPVMIVPSVRRT